MINNLQITWDRDVVDIVKLVEMITNDPEIVPKELCDEYLVFKFEKFENDDEFDETWSKIYSMCKLLQFSKIVKALNIVIDTEQCTIKIPTDYFEIAK